MTYSSGKSKKFSAWISLFRLKHLTARCLTDVINPASVYLTGDKRTSPEQNSSHPKLSIYDMSDFLPLEILIFLLLYRDCRMTSSIWHLKLGVIYHVFNFIAYQVDLTILPKGKQYLNKISEKANFFIAPYITPRFGFFLNSPPESNVKVYI